MGFVKDAISEVGGFLGDTVGEVPIVGDVVKAGAPIVGGMVGGPVGGALGGAISGGMSDQGALKGAASGLTTQQLIENMKQQRADAQKARQLANQGMDLSQQGLDVAMGQFQQDQPLRQAFRQGALNFSDPTNPLANPVDVPQQGPRPSGGTLSDRIENLLSGGAPGMREGFALPGVPTGAQSIQDDPMGAFRMGMNRMANARARGDA